MAIKILVAIHPGYTSTPALERARAIAEAGAAEIMLYSAVYDDHGAGRWFERTTSMQKDRDLLVAAEKRKLNEVKTYLMTVASAVTVNADWSYPAGLGIISAAKEFGANLIVVSSTQHSELARLVLTNTDWEVLRQATIPVLFAHHRPFKPYRTVLAAIDPTHVHDEPANLDDRIVNEGRLMSNLFSGELHLGHAYPSARTAISVEHLPLPETAEKWRLEHTRAVNELARKHHVDHTHVHLLDEVPYQAIPHLATQLSADLVVMGVVSRSFLKQLWIGRTTEYMVDRLDCDVLTVNLAADA